MDHSTNYFDIKSSTEVTEDCKFLFAIVSLGFKEQKEGISES